MSTFLVDVYVPNLVIPPGYRAVFKVGLTRLMVEFITYASGHSPLVRVKSSDVKLSYVQLKQGQLFDIFHGDNVIGSARFIREE